MQSDKKFFEDVAKMAESGLGVVSEMKTTIEQMVQTHVEKVASKLQLATREELEVVKKIAATARKEQEALEKRVAALEKQLAKKAPKKTTKAKKK